MKSVNQYLSEFILLPQANHILLYICAVYHALLTNLVTTIMAASG